jgi:DNA polymerase/3'-5' exonuclease PolX
MGASYVRAKAVADQFIQWISPVCERAEIAGGVRRQKPECHDVEIVAIPKFEPILDIFNTEIGKRNLLNEFITTQLSGWVVKPNGDRYKKIWYIHDLNVDLFIVLPPAQWGVIFTIRTGSAAFSHHIVTAKKFGGCMPSDHYCQDGAVHNADGRIIPMPGETDFLNFLGIGWIEPKDRI